jgi:hypothetical protein
MTALYSNTRPTRLPRWRYAVRQIVAGLIVTGGILLSLYLLGEVLSWFGIDSICAEDICY